VASSPPQHPGVQDTTLRIGGMHCESCAQVGPPRADQSEKTLRVIESLACNESLWYHHTCRRRRHPRLSALPQRLQTATPNKRPLPHRLSRSLPLCLDCISLAVSRTASLSVSPTVCPTASRTQAVRAALVAAPGVVDASVCKATDSARVRFTAALTTVAQLAQVHVNSRTHVPRGLNA
jgi:hypothetical protein